MDLSLAALLGLWPLLSIYIPAPWLKVYKALSLGWHVKDVLGAESWADKVKSITDFGHF